MSSMQKYKIPSVLALSFPVLLVASPIHAQQGLASPAPTDAATDTRAEAMTVADDGSPLPGWTVPANLVDSTQGNVPAALKRWEMLEKSPNFSFGEYARFLVTYPGWPQDAKLRGYAERASDISSYPANMLVEYFDRLPPTTNSGRATYAMALQDVGRKTDAAEWARKAWRGGPLSAVEQARLLGAFNNEFTPADHDARMDALIASGAVQDAGAQVGWTSPERRATFAAALGYRDGSGGELLAGAALTDPSYVGERARYYMKTGRMGEAQALLANRPALSRQPFDAEDWYEILLTAARNAEDNYNFRVAYDIASRVDDALPTGTDVSAEALGVRDDYTSLTWLAGRVALEKLGRPADAMVMFGKYGNAARTPQTMTKGFYWAAKAAKAAGNEQARIGWLQQAAEFPDYFYGILAYDELGWQLPDFKRAALSPSGRLTGNDPLYIAARLSASSLGHRDQSAFLRAVANNAKSRQDHVDAMLLAATLNRPDLYVMAGRNARVEGYDDLIAHGYPTVDIPSGEQQNYTLNHAIMRQESQFDPEAISHAGASGLMQLMPGTAREVANGLGLGYYRSRLTSDTDYNIRLGSTYIDRMLRYYGGNHVLAIAAYNAGPGNVNKWLRANGDPRRGEDVVTWIEDIPIYETKNYVQRVLENLVVYDRLYPQFARRGGDDQLRVYLGQ